jgi:hypothetical protein
MIPRNMHLDVGRVHERYQTGPAQAYLKYRPQISFVRMVLCGAFPQKCTTGKREVSKKKHTGGV